MKKVEIKQFSHAEVDEESAPFGFLKIPAKHELIRAEGENLEVSDGHHTFDELYDHRIRLFISLCKTRQKLGYALQRDSGSVWRSKLHSDGSAFEGWFILGINKKASEQITYHLPDSYWKELDWAETLECAPEWDGHTSADVLTRLQFL